LPPYLDRPCLIRQLQYRLGGIDQPGAEIRVLGKSPARGRDRLGRMSVQNRAIGQLVKAGLAVQLQQVQIGRAFDARHLQRIVQSGAKSAQPSQPVGAQIIFLIAPADPRYTGERLCPRIAF